MNHLAEIGKIGEISNGTMKEIIIEGVTILVARSGDRYYAVDGRCPHMGGKLAAGKLHGTIVTCPLHGSQFDLTDGYVVRWLKGSGLFSKLGKVFKAPSPLKTYAIKIDGDRILIAL